MNNDWRDGAWLGQWLLLPELSHYADGTAPDRATYDIEVADDETLHFGVAWWNAGQKTAVAFRGVPDGEKRTTDSPGVTHMSITARDRRRLDSAAWAEDQLVARATRRVSQDCSLMTIVQELHPASKEDPVLVFQVYIRRTDT